MKKIIKLFSLLAVVLFSVTLFSCGGDDDDDNDNGGSLNSYEQALVGTWVENDRDINTEEEVFKLVVNSNHTGSFTIYDKGKVTSTSSGTWSATSTTITTTFAGEVEGQSSSIRYTINNGLLYIGEIVYKKQ